MTSILQCIRTTHKLFKTPVRTKTDKTVLVDKDDQITLIGIAREEHRNTIDAATANQLLDAIKRFEQDSDSPVAVLYGVGGSFSAGQDVVELKQQFEQKNYNFLFNPIASTCQHLKKPVELEQQFEQKNYNFLFNPIASTCQHLKKPIVCAINGFCVASGLELALLCDLRVMEDTAVIGFANRKFGVPLCDAGTVRLSRFIGYSRSLDMLLTGRRMHAKEAFEIGLINRIVATGTSLGQAVNLAFSISKFSQNTLRHDRTSIYASVFEGKTFAETVQDEMLPTDNVITELKIGVHKFINSEKKGAQVDSFNIKEKPVPDWEKDEIKKEEEYKKEKFSF